MSLNVCTFSGRLGRDAEGKFLPNGTAVMEFSMAVDSGFGEKKTSWWLKCAMFGERGQKLTQYLTKGQQVAVSGEFVPRPYKDSSGGEKISLELRINALELLGRKRDDAPATSSAAPAPSRSSPYKKPAFDDDDSIPF